MWDDVAKAPYLKDGNGTIVCNYDDPRSIGYKCRFIHRYGMKGAMYWEYEGDDDAGSLRTAVFEGIFVP
jgi:chitinase